MAHEFSLGTERQGHGVKQWPSAHKLNHFGQQWADLQDILPLMACLYGN
ncbi:hypothetical protein [Pectobacterium aquaticum]|nr:hypothetical protein [Pectobacterium aquaticum]UEM38063.1 hypothetical protein DMB82_0012770 [Pectobacterium aquaticum]